MDIKTKTKITFNYNDLVPIQYRSNLNYLFPYDNALELYFNCSIGVASDGNFRNNCFTKSLLIKKLTNRQNIITLHEP